MKLQKFEILSLMHLRFGTRVRKNYLQFSKVFGKIFNLSCFILLQDMSFVGAPKTFLSLKWILKKWRYSCIVTLLSTSDVTLSPLNAIFYRKLLHANEKKINGPAELYVHGDPFVRNYLLPVGILVRPTWGFWFLFCFSTRIRSICTQKQVLLEALHARTPLLNVFELLLLTDHKIHFCI